MAEKIRNGVRSFLRIEPAQRNIFHVVEMLDFEGSASKNRIWYRGDADELSQLYKSLPGDGNRSRFWAAVPTTGREIRKIHTGLPAIIVDVLVDIVLTDMQDIEVEREDEWNEIAKENNWTELMDKSLTQTLFIGDGAFKINIDTNVSPYPILEYVPGDRIEYQYQYSRLQEIVFKSFYTYNSQQYVLLEIYGYGYIQYELRRDDKPVPLDSIPQTGKLSNVTFPNSFMMAVPFLIFQNSKWEGRGKSIYEGKTDNFDALDECWSQWMDALRKGRSKEYIPTDMLPRNPHDGSILKPNAFDNAYIEHESPMAEGQQKKIELIQPEIPHQSYLSTYVTCLDMCLQGIISPSTIGIDGNKLKDDTATAQMEREKVTLYTRNKIIAALQKMIPQLVNTVFKALDTMRKSSLKEVQVDVAFGEYNSPAFDAVVDVIGKARQNGIMSIEASLDELYGDSKDEKWKQEEIARIKAEQGIVEMEEPQVADSMKTETDGLASEGMTMLNGAQIGSLMNMIAMVKSGQLTRSEAINIVTATLGVPRENAETFIENGL